MSQDGRSHPILLYDGVCGLCNRMVQFVLKRDRAYVFQLAALQSGLGRRILEKHGANPSDLDTFYVVLDLDVSVPPDGEQNDRLLARSDAVSFVLQELGGVWHVAGGFFGLLPRTVRDWAYNLVARNRYRIFGRYDSCPMPSQAERKRFLDL